MNRGTTILCFTMWCRLYGYQEVTLHPSSSVAVASLTALGKSCGTSDVRSFEYDEAVITYPLCSKGGLHRNITKEDLWNLFTRYGVVKSLRRWQPVKHHLPGRDTVTTVARFLGSTAVITMQTEEVRGGCVECVKKRVWRFVVWHDRIEFACLRKQIWIKYTASSFDMVYLSCA